MFKWITITRKQKLSSNNQKDINCLPIIEEHIYCLQILQKGQKNVFQLHKKTRFVFKLLKFPSSYKKIVF